MDVKVLDETYNPLIKRKEVKIKVGHDSGGTPNRFSVRKALTSLLKAKIENVFVVNMETKTGTSSTLCDVEVYDSEDRAKKIVPKHIFERNLPPEEKAKAKAAAKPKKDVKKEEKKEKAAPPKKK